MRTLLLWWNRWLAELARDEIARRAERRAKYLRLAGRENATIARLQKELNSISAEIDAAEALEAANARAL